MRKLLAILLIMLLSLQASWAAAASYCRHEQDAPARHFGHHEHQHGQHLAKPAAQDPASLKVSLKVSLKASSVAGQADVLHAPDDDGSKAASLAGVDLDLDCSVCQAHALAGMPPALANPALDATVVVGEALIQQLSRSRPQPRPERPNWLAA